MVTDTQANNLDFSFKIWHYFHMKGTPTAFVNEQRCRKRRETACQTVFHSSLLIAPTLAKASFPLLLQ